jgi:hypothetical protein
LVRIGEFTLSRGEVDRSIPAGTASSDSVLLAENYVKKWVKDVLTYRAAVRNLGTTDADIERLVEEYRRSLLRHQYQEHMIRSRLSVEIPESDKLLYYQENTKRFILSNNLIKGLFLKVPLGAPGLDDVKKKYRKTDPKTVEGIEKFSIQNALIYEYFYDHWVDFDEIMDRIPVQVGNSAQYLKSTQSVETNDSVYCYLLNITEYMLSSNVAPFDYVLPQIEELLINKRKVEFLRRIEEELYRDAVRKGEVIFHTDKE